MVALQLVHVDTLHVATVVLEVVGQLVVQEYLRAKVIGDVELDDALTSLTDVNRVIIRTVDERKAWRIVGCIGVAGAQTVVVVRHGDPVQTGIRG